MDVRLRFKHKDSVYSERKEAEVKISTNIPEIGESLITAVRQAIAKHQGWEEK